uniref:Zinc knuckle domain-like n=1 Tax=Oryza sativa subsp. japonica TaxID=39947 RepID=Q5VMF7_ORYSJ|nr:zinc knuckle domain-like [Oryza sativa Japonica Group]
MAAGPPAPIPSPPAALSPFQPYINPPRTSSVRFRLSPPFLLAGIELAPSLSLFAITAELRSAVVVAPDHLPPRRRLFRLRRILADLVHPSISLVDRRSAAVPVDPNHAAAFLRSGRLFVVAVDLGRSRPRVRLTRGAHGAGWCEPGCTWSTVDREAAAWAPLPWTRLAQFFPNPEEEPLEDEGFGV